MSEQQSNSIRVLIVEDEPDDAQLVVAELRRSGIDPIWQRVETEPEFIEQLSAGPDIVLADYHLPAFGALRALELQQVHAVDVPVIVVSGMIGEEAAVDCLRRGATDYVLKDRHARLAPAVERARRERAVERARQAAEAGLRLLTAELEQRVEARTAQLETANRELEAFSYSVSHDLRSPLLAISGFTELLDQQCGEALSENGRRYLADILSAGQSMGRLIEDFVRLSQVARRDLVHEHVDLSAITRAVAEGLRESNPGRSVSFLIEDGLEVVGDAELLRIVLTNLLGNAWKYTREQSTPRIEFGRVEFGRVEFGGAAAYFVRDNGVGFDPSAAGQLFEPFHRLHQAEGYEGSGVGLATVKRVIVRHEGRVWADGAAGQGAAFYFTLGA